MRKASYVEMGGCCCCAYRSSELNASPRFFHHPVSEEHLPLSPHRAPVSPDLLVDTNLDTSVPDTYRPPPAPIPYESCAENPTTTSGNREGSANKSEVALETSNRESIEEDNSGRTLDTKVKKLESDENVEKDVELETPKLLEDEKSEELKKSVVPQLQDEECPICLEEYDVENPKIITKCDHHFHLACILEWMERSETCPVCDQEMVISPDIGG